MKLFYLSLNKIKKKDLLQIPSMLCAIKAILTILRNINILNKIVDFAN